MLKIKTYFVVVIFFLLLISCTNQSQKNTSKEINLEEITIEQLHDGYKSGKFTIKEVVQAYIDRIEAIDSNGPTLNSVITINPDALEIAAELDKNMNDISERGLLYGVPVLLKDNIDTHDKMPCTAGSRALENSFPLQDSYVAKRLREAGAIILGKTNLSEWANFRGELSTSGWSGLGGQTRNPYDPNRNPCGSSSGSGVAVSANFCIIAIGTETNGSIVCPSHANGIVGIKPTVGLISRSGIIPISFTQDTPGPMARTLTDAVICLGLLTGIDSADSKTTESAGHFLTDYTPFLKKDGLKGKRIGVFTGVKGINYKVDSLMNNAVRFMKNSGAEIIEISKIYEPNVDENSFEIMLHEYRDGLNNYFRSLGDKAPIHNLEELISFNKSDSVELQYFNQAYLEMALSKEGTKSEKYRIALNKMLRGSRENGLDKTMNTHRLDAIIAPTGTPAWLTDHTNGDSFHFGTSSAAAQAGYPNITVPMGFIDGLPVGISFFGRAWSEPLLIEIAYGYEAGRKHRKAPIIP